MAAIYNSQLDAFDLYHLSTESKEKASILSGPALPAIGHALAGATGSAIANTAVYPLDLIITRLQIQRQLKHSSQGSSQHYDSTIDAARKIYRNEGGLSALYAGVREDTTKSIADAFLFFLSYNFLRQLRVKRLSSPSEPLPAIDELSVGFAAGALSKLFTTPIANVVTRMQTSSMVQSDKSHKITASTVAQQIRAEKGISGFWSGYSASLVLTLNPSLTFFFFETLKRLTLPQKSREHPTPAATFFLAALSKALASTITYPFSLAKARAQSSSKAPSDSDDPTPDKTAAEKSSSSRSRGNQAAQKTVFATVIAIARTEGLAALYEGLEGEVFKGFFSHGITMLVKEAVHKFIIQLYYLGLKLLQRYPSAHELAERAREAGHTVQDQVKGASKTVQDHMKGASQTVQGQAQETLDAARTNAGAAGERLQQAGKDASEMVRHGFENAKDSLAKK